MWTRDVGRAMRMARRLQFGCVWVNTHIPLTPEMPHGGYKQSGHGKDMSVYSLEDYTEHQARDGVARLAPIDAAARHGAGASRSGRPRPRRGDDPMAEIRPYLVNGEWRTGEGTFEVHSPFDDSVVAEIGVPTEADVEEAVATAAATVRGVARSCRSGRAPTRSTTSPSGCRETIEENAKLIAAEGGKPLKWATVEATRAVSHVPLGLRGDPPRRRRGDAAGHRGRRSARALGILRRFPIGPVLGITPFNFPLNLVAHKVAPSLAVGAPIVVKPASATPIGSLRLAEFFAETDLPKGMYQVLPVSSKVADGMARDDRFRKISFTGSSEIGWYLKGLDPKKRVTLELGGNAGVIVHCDADLDLAAQRIAFGGYYQAGQSCISVQRVLVASRGLRRLRGAPHEAGGVS